MDFVIAKVSISTMLRLWHFTLSLMMYFALPVHFHVFPQSRGCAVIYEYKTKYIIL